MTISEERLGGVIVVAPVGRIDSSTSDVLDAHLQRLSTAGFSNVVIDFAGVEYISSAGLRVLLTLARRVRESRGGLALASLNDSVRLVFELAGFVPLFVIEPSRASAVDTLAGR